MVVHEPEVGWKNWVRLGGGDGGGGEGGCQPPMGTAGDGGEGGKGGGGEGGGSGVREPTMHEARCAGSR